MCAASAHAHDGPSCRRARRERSPCRDVSATRPSRQGIRHEKHLIRRVPTADGEHWKSGERTFKVMSEYAPHQVDMMRGVNRAADRPGARPSATRSGKTGTVNDRRTLVHRLHGTYTTGSIGYPGRREPRRGDEGGRRCPSGSTYEGLPQAAKSSSRRRQDAEDIPRAEPPAPARERRSAKASSPRSKGTALRPPHRGHQARKGHAPPAPGRA